MPDQRSVMKEYRYLDEKRLAEGLTPAEQARLEKLRVLVGPESGAGSMKPGFDVNAAAAALRESLLPAGLRNRPPPPPPAAPEPAPVLEPEPEPAATLHDALASEYAESPFAPLEAPAEPPQDPLFDPSSLGTEPAAYDPSAAQPYDAGAQPYDPNAYPADAAYDPNAPQQAWDGTPPWDPNGAPQDAAAYPADAAYDPNAPQAWDPNQPWDPNAAPAEAQPGEPGAYADAAYGAGEAQAQAQGWDATPPWDPNAAAYPADGASSPDASQQAWDPNQPWDPNAAPAEAQPGEPGAYADAAYGAGAPAPQAWDAPAEPAVDAAAEEVTDLSADELTEIEPIPGEAVPPEGGSFEAADAGAPAGWDAEPAQPAPASEPAFGEYDAAGGVEPFAPGTLGAEPPLDASAFGERLAQEAPPAAPAIPSVGEYDDTAGFAAEPFDASSVPPDAPGLDAPAAAELDGAWQPEAALDAGFELASGGSFGAGADAAAPEWAQSPAPPPWEGTPPLDLQAAPAEQVAEEETGYEISPAPASESFAPGHAADLFGAPEGDLAAPAEDGLAEGGAAPELDFSQPDFSGGAEPDGMEPQADLSGGSFALSGGTDAATPEQVDLGSAPPLDLGETPAPAEGDAPAWDAPAPEAPLDLAAEPALPELPPPAEAPPIPELTPPPDETFLDATEVIEEVPAEETAPETAPALAPEAAAPPEEAAQLDAAAPADDAMSSGEAAPGPAEDVLQFAEAAAAAVASESTDLSEVIEAPPAVDGEAPPPVDDFALDVAEAPPADLGAGEPSFDAATALAGGATAEAPPTPADFAAPLEEAIALGVEEHAPLEPAADVDLSFDLGGEPPPAEEPQAAAAGAEEPSPLEAALAAAPPAEAAPVADEEIPTIDGADILEEIVEDGAPAAPPQSLEFEPLAPEPPPAPPPAVVSPPPAPAPVAVAPPPAAAVLAPPPPVLAPPPAVAAPPPAPAPPEPASAAPPQADYRVAGSHRVVVHTIEGLVKRGVLDDPALDAPSLALAPQPGGAREEVPAEKVKAIFFMLSPGEKAPAAEGKRVRVTFRDGRQIAGFSPDYHEEGIGFFMIPADTKTNTGRIWVYRAAVRQVAIS